MQRYKAAYKHRSDYITYKHQSKDIPVRSVDHRFITGLEIYLKSSKSLEHNTAIKYIVNFKKIWIAYANEWITKVKFLLKRE